MPAPKGHERWGNPINPKKYTPEKLWVKAIEYFDWVEDNPLHERKAFMFQGIIVTDDAPKMRAMTVKGFCIFADISEVTFYSYEKDETFLNIITRIREIIYEQKFTGAAAELLNPNIIARELGLSDKIDNKLSGEVKTTPNVVVMDEKTKAEIDKLLSAEGE